MPDSAARVSAARVMVRFYDEAELKTRIVDDWSVPNAALVALFAATCTSDLGEARRILQGLAEQFQWALPTGWNAIEVNRALACVDEIDLKPLRLEIGGDPPLVDLERFFTFGTRPALDEQGALEIIAQLRWWPIVADAWTRNLVPNAARPTESAPGAARPWEEFDCCPRQQRHFAPAPIGLGIQDFLARSPARGEGTRLFDIEGSWDSPLHEGLVHGDIERLFVDAPDTFRASHGTAVLGLVLARPTAEIAGIAPAAAAVLIPLDVAADEDPLNGVACGILAAVIRRRRDVPQAEIVLIEEQTPYTSRPVETDPLVCGTIQYATACGMIVVEAAGNDGSLIDPRPRPGDPLLERKEPRLLPGDSGAIIVGALQEIDGSLDCGPREACWPRPTDGEGFQGYERHRDSNYGCRVTFYAPGSPTLTLGRVVKGGADRFATFDRTSAASAIVAGAILLLQSHRLSQNLAPLERREVRDRLSRFDRAPNLALPDDIGCGGSVVMPSLPTADD